MSRLVMTVERLRGRTTGGSPERVVPRVTATGCDRRAHLFGSIIPLVSAAGRSAIPDLGHGRTPALRSATGSHGVTLHKLLVSMVATPLGLGYAPRGGDPLPLPCFRGVWDHRSESELRARAIEEYDIAYGLGHRPRRHIRSAEAERNLETFPTWRPPSPAPRCQSGRSPHAAVLDRASYVPVRGRPLLCWRSHLLEIG